MSVETKNSLPPAFSDWEGYVADWAVSDINARTHIRATRSFEDLRSFYDALAPRADEALSYLSGFPLHDLPEPEDALYRLLMMLAHVSMSIEQHKQNLPDGAVFPNTIRVVKGLLPG